MENSSAFGYESPTVRAYFRDRVAVIHFTCDIYCAFTDLDESARLLPLFHQAETDPDVTALLLLHSPECFSAQSHRHFIECILAGHREISLPPGHSPFTTMQELVRYHTVLNRIILHIAEFRKLSVVGVRGSVVTPFFGAALAADFRFAAPDLCFSPIIGRDALPPGGALPFFLPHYVGHGKAAEILLRGDDIPAEEALRLGLINRILPAEEFEDHCIAEIASMAAMPAEVVGMTKLLLGYSKADLKTYFDREAVLLR